MSNVLERIQQLLALSTSPNEHEARNAALLAARLIREHKVQLALPARSPTPRETRRTTPREAPRKSTPKQAARRSSSGGRRARVSDPPERIESPLGGDCLACGGRYRAGQSIFWFTSGGGMHPACFEKWRDER